MKLHLFILFVILFSCSPTLHQLKEIEFVAGLKNGQLQVPIKSVEEDVALLKKYGQDKKAERLLRKTERKNQWLKDAFTENYNFSEVQFVDEDSLDLTQPWLKLSEEVDVHEEYEEEQLLFQVIEQGNTKLTYTHDGNMNQIGYAVKQWNKHLERLYEKVEE